MTASKGITTMPRSSRLIILTLCALVTAFGCSTGTDGQWSCDVTITWGDRTASGSGTGATETEARTAALRVACPKLGVSGDQLTRCQQGHPLGGDWRLESDCETT